MTKKLAKKIENKVATLKKMGVSMTNLDLPLHGWTLKTWMAVYDRVTLELLARPVAIAENFHLNHATLEEMLKRCVVTRAESGQREISYDKLKRYYGSYIQGRVPALYRMLSIFGANGSQWIIDKIRQARVYYDLCEVEIFYQQLPRDFAQKIADTLFNWTQFIEESPQAKFYAECFESERAEKEGWLSLQHHPYIPREAEKNAVIVAYVLMALLIAAAGLQLLPENKALQRTIACDCDGSLMQYAYKLLFTLDVAWTPVMGLSLLPLASSALMFLLYHSNNDLFGLKNRSYESALKNYRRWDGAELLPAEKKLATTNMHSLFKVRAMQAPNPKNVDSLRDAFKELRRMG